MNKIITIYVNVFTVHGVRSGVSSPIRIRFVNGNLSSRILSITITHQFLCYRCVRNCLSSCRDKYLRRILLLNVAKSSKYSFLSNPSLKTGKIIVFTVKTSFRTKQLFSAVIGAVAFFLPFLPSLTCNLKSRDASMLISTIPILSI